MKARKRDFTALCVSRAVLLQWGRADEGAETWRKWDGRKWATAELQWGRADEGAETTVPGGGRLIRLDSFNGAAPMKARKPTRCPLFAVLLGSFNGAAPMKARKHPEGATQFLTTIKASMGPRR